MLCVNGLQYGRNDELQSIHNICEKIDPETSLEAHSTALQILIEEESAGFSFVK